MKHSMDCLFQPTMLRYHCSCDLNSSAEKIFDPKNLMRKNLILTRNRKRLRMVTKDDGVRLPDWVKIGMDDGEETSKD